ncbi:hypothetical protein D1Y85_04250 [Paraburkholderia dinghuensis]|uniref:Uncharacterized protein n=1 Tax=Paraburkholderia dinghuensis TaxID=2305225 RepID=A0A3N6NCN2_9BURK|nr:hypothetical protein D1Y85_04250 [Paraburkholderia dinghuensis]
MFTFIVVLLEPHIKISLQGVQRFVDFLPEGNAIELVEHGRVRPLIDPVDLWRLGFRVRLMNVLHGHRAATTPNRAS